MITVPSGTKIHKKYFRVRFWRNGLFGEKGEADCSTRDYTTLKPLKNGLTTLQF